MSAEISGATFSAHIEAGARFSLREPRQVVAADGTVTELPWSLWIGVHSPVRISLGFEDPAALDSLINELVEKRGLQ